MKIPGLFLLKSLFTDAPEVVLASASPRRREILALTGVSFGIDPAEVDERILPGEAPRAHVERLALAKAEAVAPRWPRSVILGCDTVVVLDGGNILGKPQDGPDAARMLRLLSGKEHAVLSGVAVLRPATGARQVVTVETRVRFKPLTEGEIAWYVESGEPMDKAGAYAIQGRGGIFVEGIVGPPSNVVGLPLMMTTLLLRGVGLAVAERPGAGG